LVYHPGGVKWSAVIVPHTDIAHAMVGHTTYLGMYDRKTDSEMLELYLKVEPLLEIS